MPVMSRTRGKDVYARRSEWILQAVKALKTKNLSQEVGEMIVIVKREEGAITMKQIKGKRSHRGRKLPIS